jgi:outer membrane receptor protein involved in Fe transport
VPNASEPGTTVDNNVSWTARAAYAATSQLKFYASASSGFKPSSVNLSRNSLPLASSGLAGPVSIPIVGPGGVAIPNPYTGQPLVILNPAYGSRAAGPEHSYNYEAGMKGNWGKATLNVAVFKEIIKGFQSNIFTGTGFFLANAGQESNWGIEAEGSYRPTRELTLSGAVNWYNPHYDSFAQSSVGSLTGQKPADITPVTVNLSVQDVHPVGQGDHLILRAGWHYESKTQLVDGLPGEVVKNPLTQAVISYAPAITDAQQFTRTVSQIDASATYAFRTGVDLMVWARNLNNQRYLVLVFDSPAQSGSISGYPSEPRTYGVTARVKW